MTLLQLSAALITATAVFAWLNHLYVRLPTTIGVMVMGLAASLALIGLDALGVGVADRMRDLLASIAFDRLLLEGMLSFLLFAGALHINLDDLRRQGAVVGTLALVGVVVSTLVVGTLAHFGFALFGLSLPWLPALLFGALISPTDPIAVLSILKRADIAKSLEIKVTGESLFNDGVGVVVFLLLLGMLTGGEAPSAGHVAGLFLLEAGGGLVFGLALGWLGNAMLRRIDQYQVEVMLTLAVVLGGYALASAWHLSGPIAIVVAGLLIGNHGRHTAMSARTEEYIDRFWELIDEMLNALLFVLIGVEVLLITPKPAFLLAGALAVPIVLIARWASVAPTIRLLSLRRPFSPGIVRVLVWGGLRGGISVALALSLPAMPERDLIVTATYCVVMFSILVQGLTLGRVARGR